MDRLRTWWKGLSDGERRAILIVTPVVAIALIVAALRGRQRADDESARDAKATTDQVTDTTPGGIVPGGPTGVEPGAAIGVDQLAGYQDAVSGMFDEVYGNIDELTGIVEGITVGESPPGADPDDPPPQETVGDSTQRVLDLMTQLGFPSGYVHGTGESREELAARLARQIDTGARTYASVREDLRNVIRQRQGGGGGGSGGSGSSGSGSSDKSGDGDTTRRRTSGKTYTIQSGDTLWGIAERFYGDGSKYRRIWRANRAKLARAARQRGQSPSPDRIWPGTTITIP